MAMALITAEEHANAAADERMDRMFERVDTDGDGVITEAEREAAKEKMREATRKTRLWSPGIVCGGGPYPSAAKSLGKCETFLPLALAGESVRLSACQGSVRAIRSPAQRAATERRKRLWSIEICRLSFRVAYRMLQDRAEAEDVTQETFLRAWKTIARLAAQGKILDLGLHGRAQSVSGSLAQEKAGPDG